MKNNSVNRIALIGPESTGKTALCRELAAHFHSPWVPEFSREFTGNLGRRYTMQDVVYCASEQIRAEADKLKEAKHFLFCDTELINIKVWLLDVFGTYPGWMEDKIKKNPHDLYLLTAPDLPFENDPVRENPHRREYFFDWYEKELKDYGFRYSIIRGAGPARLQAAISETERIALSFPG